MYLNKDVYLVKGINNAVIYDFYSNIMYHLNSDAKDFLTEVLNHNLDNLSIEQLAFLSELKKKGIITDQYVAVHDIGDLKINPKIDFVWIEITTGCNLKCIHCYDKASPFDIKTMSYSDFCHIIDEVSSNGIKKIQIIGGEPFILGDELKLYLNYCIGKFDFIEIFTNGTLITSEWIEYLRKNMIHIAISVYSYIEDEHNKITKNNISYKLTTANIQKLKNSGIKYRVKNVIMSNLNIGEQNTSLYKLSHTHDIVRMVGRANLSLLDETLIRKKLITFQTFSGKISKGFVSRLISGHNCFSRRLYFSTDLNVYPCVMERRISHGNLRNIHLKDLLQQEIIEYGKDHIRECKDCEFRYSCFDCRPDALDTSIECKPWYCTYNPYKGEWADIDKFIDSILHTPKT